MKSKQVGNKNKKSLTFIEEQNRKIYSLIREYELVKCDSNITVNRYFNYLNTTIFQNKGLCIPKIEEEKDLNSLISMNLKGYADNSGDHITNELSIFGNNFYHISQYIKLSVFKCNENLIKCPDDNKDFWEGFLQSEQYKRLRNFLWFQDRRVVPDDFFTMRVLGRGGFGSVIGKCHDFTGSSVVGIVSNDDLSTCSLQEGHFGKALCDESYE